MKKILVIGAGFLQSFVIQKAKTMGYYTLAVDGSPTAPGFVYADKSAVINIVDELACLEFAKQEKIDGVLTAATDYGVLTAAYIAQEMGLPGLHYRVAQTIKNKYQVRKCLFENRVDDTNQAYEVDDTTDLKSLAQKLQYPVMVKPCDGSGSRGAGRVDSPNQLASACIAAMNASITHRAEIESFINGQEYGAESLVVNGQVYVLGIMKKWMTQPPYYAELGHAIPSGLAEQTERYVRTCVEKAIKALGVNFGSINMDMLITDDGKVYIVDIGARMGGNMIGPWVVPYGTGIDYMGAMLANAVGDPVCLEPQEARAVATRLLAFTDGTVTSMPDVDALEKKYDVQICHHLTLNQPVHEYHTNLDGCGYIVACRKTAEEAAETALKVLEEIRAIIFS